MKAVMNSLRNMFPGNATKPDEPEIEPHEAAAPAPAPAEPEPSKLVRQMIDMADIRAAEAEAELAGDPIDKTDRDSRDPVLEERVMEAIKTVRDPEIPIDLVALGLIYDFSADQDGKVFIEMTLTTPNCPSAADLPSQIEQAAAGVDGVTDVRVKLVFTPPWHQGLMSEEARLELGLL